MMLPLSSVRDNHDDVDQVVSSGNKRKSLSFLLPSSPTKLKRVDRSDSRGSSLSLLSTSSFTTRLSPFSPKHSKRPFHVVSPNSRKSPPTCTISLESVTVNICDEDRNLSKSFAHTIPLDTVDVNVIPFPSGTLGEPEPQASPGPLAMGRRRRSNHLLVGHKRSSSVHSISSLHRKENPPFAAPTPPCRQPSTPKKRKVSSSTASSSQPSSISSYSFKDMRFISLVRRSILNISWIDKMDVDDDEGRFGSGSVTFDILSDSEDDREGDENEAPEKQQTPERIMHDQDVLLVDRLGKHLADWGYREREPLAPLSSPPSPLRMPLAPVALSAVSLSTPAVSIVQSSLMSPLVVIPDIDGHAAPASSSFLNAVDNQDFAMDIDVDRPQRPTSPVARFLEPSDENCLPISPEETVERSRQPLVPLFSPPLPYLDSVPLNHPPIMAPIPSPPASPFAPGSLSSPQRVLTPSQLVATLVLRHREKLAVRPRGYSQVGNSAAGKGTRRRSPLACEL
ncbi:hypothetical protein BDP27DRAFT_815275 [Rhodocollybia butyracea]|uniref:Uncharacterized protein n=1 Tax=Rhodocollybia butyracea TaxID=206335 RepID=A0A9P5PMA4_9AGAR|nr:hypothetical protein BDP27DRAFT_815275 [Rhodocollybia butyracea]